MLAASCDPRGAPSTAWSTPSSRPPTTLGRRLPAAAGTLNETTYATWFAGASRRRARRRRVRRRRPERVHARVDREPLPRLPAGGGPRRARPRASRVSSCASATASSERRHAAQRPSRLEAAGAAATGASRAQPEVHVRQLRDRLVEPVRPRGRARRRRGAGAGVQPALHLRRHRSRQDAPAAGDRRLRERPLEAPDDALRHERDVHERLHQLAARQAHRGLQAPLPRLRRAARRRHPVLRGQGADPGGVLPHLQLALRGRRADRDLVRPAAEGDRDARGAAALAVRVGADHRHPAARPRDAHRDPAQEGDDRRGSRSPTPRC